MKNKNLGKKVAQAKLVVFIPARGRSTGLPGKNVQLLDGRPLFWYSIKFARECGIEPQDIYLSSDDIDTLDLAKKYGINQVRRPPKLAASTSSMYEAIQHFLDEVNNKDFYYILILQPTNPLRRVHYYSEALEKIKSDNIDCVFTVNRFCKKIGKLDEENLYVPVLNSPTQRRQDIDDLYVVDGMLFLFKVESFCKYKSILGNRYSVIVTDEIFGYNDIDTELDFKIVEYLLMKYRNKFSI